MKIGFLICGSLPEPAIAAHGNYSELYKELLGGQDFTFESWNVFEGEMPNSPEDADGWLISGSKFGAYEGHDWIPPLEAFVRDTVAAVKPLVGICFGHQLIAQALGGKVEKFDGGWTIGRQTYDFAGLDLPLMAWHQDQVTELPEGAQVVASTDSCKYAAVLYGNRAFTMQPHPEFDGETIEILSDINSAVVPKPLLDAAAEDVNDPLSNEVIADQISDFFRMSRDA
jgi:GMP synthase (glutamine-hydrolysing)